MHSNKEAETTKTAKTIVREILRPYSKTPKTAQVLAHHGIKGQKWGVRRSKEELERIASVKIQDTNIFKSVGAKAKNYGILDPETGERLNFSEGTKIQDSTVFAGKGASHSLRENVRNGLSEKYGGNPMNWQHCKGKGVINYYGEDRPAEVHWFQEETAGKHRFKVKKWLDE